MMLVRHIVDIVRSMVPYRHGPRVDVNHDGEECAARQELATSNEQVKEQVTRIRRQLTEDHVIAQFVHGVNALRQRDIADEEGE